MFFSYYLLPSIHTQLMLPSCSDLAAGSQTHRDLCTKDSLPDTYRTNPFPLCSLGSSVSVWWFLPDFPPLLLRSAPTRLSVPFASSCSDGGGGLGAKSCPTLATPWTAACQAPLSMGFSRTTGVGCHFLLQGIFPTQDSNPGLLHCRQILDRLSYKGSPVLI